MNRPEFDEFAALWNDAPTDAEKAQFELDARTARRRGRMLDYIDYAVAAILLIMTVGYAFASPNPVTVALAVPLMIVVTWLTWKRRAVRQMARTLDTEDRASFIASSLRNASANLRRNTIGLVSLPFVVPIALALKVTMRTGGGPLEVWEAFLLWTQTVRAPITVVAILVIAAFTLRTRRKLKAEIEKLETLRKNYEQEATEMDV